MPGFGTDGIRGRVGEVLTPARIDEVMCMFIDFTFANGEDEGKSLKARANNAMYGLLYGLLSLPFVGTNFEIVKRAVIFNCLHFEPLSVPSRESRSTGECRYRPRRPSGRRGGCRLTSGTACVDQPGNTHMHLE